MKRSAFLWITGLGATMLGVIRFDLARTSKLRTERYIASSGRQGRCQSARGAARWYGFTIDELLA